MLSSWLAISAATPNSKPNITTAMIDVLRPSARSTKMLLGTKLTSSAGILSAATCSVLAGRVCAVSISCTPLVRSAALSPNTEAIRMPVSAAIMVVVSSTATTLPPILPMVLNSCTLSTAAIMVTSTNGMMINRNRLT